MSNVCCRKIFSLSLLETLTSLESIFHNKMFVLWLACYLVVKGKGFELTPCVYYFNRKKNKNNSNKKQNTFLKLKYDQVNRNYVEF